MDRNKTEWIICPKCNGKTRIQVLPDTVLERFPLYCPKCKNQFLINVRRCKIEKIAIPKHTI